MSITINGNGTITGYTPTTISGSITPTQINGNIAASKMPSGSIIQVAKNNYTGAPAAITVSNGSTVDLPYTVTITSTLANSKFLITGTVNGEPNASDHLIGIILKREIGGTSTAINIGDTSGSRSSITAQNMNGYHSNDSASTPSSNALALYLDEPNQAANTAITYKYCLIGLGAGASYYLGQTANSGNNAAYERMANHITVLEVAP